MNILYIEHCPMFSNAKYTKFVGDSPDTEGTIIDKYYVDTTSDDDGYIIDENAFNADLLAREWADVIIEE